MRLIDRLDEIHANSVTLKEYEDILGSDYSLENSKLENRLMLFLYFSLFTFHNERKQIETEDMDFRMDGYCPTNTTQPYVVKIEPEGAVLEYKPKYGEMKRIVFSRDSVIESAREAFQKVVIDKSPNKTN